MKRYEYFGGAVLLVIDEGDPIPSQAEIDEADRLKAAIEAGDHQVSLVPCDEFPGCQRVVWSPVLGPVA